MRKRVRSAEEIKQDIRDGSKICSGCDERLPFERFAESKGRADGFDCLCKDCKGVYYRSRRDKMARTKIKSRRFKEEIAEDLVVGSKVCNACGERLEFSSFTLDNSKVDRLSVACRLCQRKKELQTNHAVRSREHNIKKYGITLEQFDEMHNKQSGACAICGSTDSKSKSTYRLFIDHNHDTGEVRGLLCAHCNTALGLLNEDTARMYNMIEYISKDSL